MRIWLLVPLQHDLFRRPWKAHWLSTTSYYFHCLRNRWPCTLIFGRTSVAYGFNTPYRLWHAAAGIELSSSRRRKRRVLLRPELIGRMKNCVDFVYCCQKGFSNIVQIRVVLITNVPCQGIGKMSSVSIRLWSVVRGPCKLIPMCSTFQVMTYCT